MSRYQRTVSRICACDAKPFFDAHVRGATPIDFDRWLRLAGLRTQVSRAPVLGSDGQPSPDTRVFVNLYDGEPNVRLVSSRPDGAWGRAGLHTGDQIVSIEFAGPVTALARVNCSIGERFFTDLLSFVFVDGRWQIIAKVFHYDLRS